MAPVEVQLQPTSGPCEAYNPVSCAASTGAYLAYLPVYLGMGGIGGLARWCPLWSRQVDLLLSRHPAEVLGDVSGAANDLRPGADDCDQFTPGDDTGPPFSSPLDHQQLAAVAELNLGNVVAARAIGNADGNGPFSLAYLEQLRENLWRYAGDYGLAAGAAAEWAKLQPSSSQAPVEEGEIAFLRHRYDQAATYFAVAVNRSRYVQGGPTDDQAGALLDQGTALAYAGRRPEALAILATANETAIRAYEADPSDSSGTQLAAYADEEGATMLLDANDPDEAAEDFAVAADSARRAGLGNAQTAAGAGLNLAVLDNNYAIAELAVGDPSAAVTLVQTSIDQDPGDAIFWWTEAQAQQQAGHRVAAIAAYRKALARDPTEFPAANNLGVLLLDRGNVGAAVSALRRSVGAAPDYATGWFNLAVALGRQGPLHVFASEGALARAEELNSSLAKRAPKPYLDNAVYLSHLDLSKATAAQMDIRRLPEPSADRRRRSVHDPGHDAYARSLTRGPRRPGRPKEMARYLRAR